MEAEKRKARGRLDITDLKGTRWVWQLGGLTTRELIARVVSDSRRDRVFGWAAELSFYFLLAFFPLLIFASSLAGLILSDDRALSDRIMAYLKPTMPEPAAELAQSIFNQVLSQSSHAGVGLGLLFALWTASYGMEAIIGGMNAAFDVAEFRPWWKRRALAMLMTAVTGLAILLPLLIIVVGGRLGTRIAAWLGDSQVNHLWSYFEWGVLLLCLFGGVSLIYMYAPNLRYQPWLATLPGTIVAVAIWIAVSFAFRLYIDQFFGSYVSMYGSLGSGVAILLWLYISSAALLIGAEVNSEIRWAASNAGSPEARASLEQGNGE